MATAGQQRLGQLMRKQRSKPRFETLEDRVRKLFKERRDRGRKVSAAWIRSTARREALKLIPDERFMASAGWLRRFAKRCGITPRSKTNVKLESVADRLPRVRHFHRSLRKLLKTPFAEDIPLDPVWGRYPPEFRFNMDQVPLPFIQELDRTYEQKGAKRVWIKQPGSGSLSKRQATLILTLCSAEDPELQVKPGLIFRGTGARIAASERAAYDKRVDVFFQPKAWFDENTGLQWIDKSFSPVLKKVAVLKRRALLINDGLHAQTTEKFKERLGKNNCDQKTLPPNVTEMAQVVDAGPGRLAKQQIAFEQDKWLDDDDNLETWEAGNMEARDRRILLTKWVRSQFVDAHRSAVCAGG